MRNVHATSVIVVIALMVAASLTAQQKPNFSGTWVAVSPSDAAGQVQTVRQTETTLTRGHDSRGGGHSFTYTFDGTESRTVSGHVAVTLATASWDGDKLVLVHRTTYQDGRVRHAKFVWSINAQGELVADFTEQFEGKEETRMRIVSRRRP